MAQSHGLSLWRESAGSGALPSVTPLYLVRSGTGVLTSTSGPDAFAFFDLEGTGDYTLLDLAPVYLVSDGDSGLAVASAGPAIAVIADDGAGGLEVTMDLTRAPIADLFYDPGGDLWAVRRTTDRLDAVLVNDDARFY